MQYGLMTSRPALFQEGASYRLLIHKGYKHTQDSTTATHTYTQTTNHFSANDAPQEHPCSALGLPIILKEERISSRW